MMDFPGKEAGIYENQGIAAFLYNLSPGIGIMLQFDSQPPGSGTFQGILNGTALITDYSGFPGLLRIAVGKINAVAVLSPKDSKHE